MRLPYSSPLLGFVAPLLVLALVGCNQINPPIAARDDPFAANKINLESQTLRDNIAVSPAIVERRNGILYVTIPIRSTSNFDLHLDYKVTFFNANGAIVYQSQWEAMPTIVRNIPSQIPTLNSTDSTAADWQIDLRESR